MTSNGLRNDSRRDLLHALPILLLVFSVFCYSGYAFAQIVDTAPHVTVSADATIATVQVQGYERSSVTVAGATLAFGASHIAVRTNGLISRFASGSLAGYGDVSALGLFQQRPYFIAIETEGGAGTYRGYVASRYMGAGFRIGVGDHIWGRFVTSRARDTADYTTLNAALTATTRHHALGFSATLGATRAREQTIGNAGLEMTVSHPRLQLSASAGMQTQLPNDVVGRRGWKQLAATVPLLPRLALTVAAGRMPADIERGILGARTMSVGIRVLPFHNANSTFTPIKGPSSTSMTVESSNTDRTQTLVLRYPNATRIEYRGDFTGWRAMPMTHTTNGTWTAPLTLAPGLYTITIRIDGGEWRVPPGVPSISDDFGGANGLLVIQ